jgi:hypothetical protein
MGLLLFTRLGLSPHRLTGGILHHDLRLSAEESVIARQRIVHYRTRTLYPCITWLLYLKESSEVDYGTRTACPRS